MENLQPRTKGLVKALTTVDTYQFPHLILKGKQIQTFKDKKESVSLIDRDVGFWIGFPKEGPWESFLSATVFNYSKVIITKFS
ncbi:hypothetical protein C5167_022160 [Papaver somniferum]|uniref:Uncharacterized protein n=1 Tax=Papaver somniferum TaxID=3469 RepID=A0A4Y7JK63_PAPSO|nr:hypothetical protein C5167_022160 [Papaver somniferum]